MSKYLSLRRNPPKLTVVKNAREVIITTISCMCDNKHYLTLKKNSEGDFKLHTHGHAFSNWQCGHPIHKLEWAADAGEWTRVFEMINNGTGAVSEVESR